MTKERRLKKITTKWQKTIRKLEGKEIPVAIKKIGGKYKIRKLILQKRGPKFSKTQAPPGVYEPRKALNWE
jgi:hypothetical protein